MRLYLLGPVVIFLFLISASQAGEKKGSILNKPNSVTSKVFLILKLKYIRGVIEVSQSEVIQHQKERRIYRYTGSYALKLFDTKKEIDTFYFDFPLLGETPLFNEEPQKKRLILLQAIAGTSVEVPYYKNLKRIEIIDPRLKKRYHLPIKKDL